MELSSTDRGGLGGSWTRLCSSGTKKIKQIVNMR